MTAPRRFAMSGFDLLLYAGVIWGWSTSWYAMTHQAEMAPEPAVFWRFLFTAPLLFLLARWRGEALAFPLRDHIGLALTGLCMFSTNFVLMYHASAYMPSGLMAVIFSLGTLMNLVLGRVLFGEPFRLRLALGGLLGVLGVLALSSPRIAGAGATPGTWVGLALAAAATLSFSLGSQVSSRLQRGGLGVLASAGWGAVYGALFAAVYGLALGRSFVLPLSLPFWLSMAFLVLSASVLAFYSYLTLVGRIGPARASYAAVIFPFFALLISTVFEGYRWNALALLGLVFALAGNVIVLRREERTR